MLKEEFHFVSFKNSANAKVKLKVSNFAQRQSSSIKLEEKVNLMLYPKGFIKFIIISVVFYASIISPFFFVIARSYTVCVLHVCTSVCLFTT